MGRGGMVGWMVGCRVVRCVGAGTNVNICLQRRHRCQQRYVHSDWYSTAVLNIPTWFKLKHMVVVPSLNSLYTLFSCVRKIV